MDNEIIIQKNLNMKFHKEKISLSLNKFEPDKLLNLITDLPLSL
jgi:hypothetical protein